MGGNTRGAESPLQGSAQSIGFGHGSFREKGAPRLHRACPGVSRPGPVPGDLGGPGHPADLPRGAGPPLDDTYIYLQYARSTAAGHPFQYQAGAEPTRGATSLLYPFLLAPAARVLDRDGLVWAAFVLGVLLLALTALAADRWAARRLDPGWAWAAGLLVLASGHMVWGALSGMDIALYALALTGSVAAIPWYLDAPGRSAGARRLAVLGLWLVFLGLARPEGLLPAFLIALALPLARRAPQSPRARLALVLAPLAAAAITFGAAWIALGTPAANTLAAKAVWSEQRPDVRAAMIHRLPWVLGRISTALFTDFRSAAYGHGTGALLAALLLTGAGAGALVLLRGRRGRPALPGRVLVGVIAAGLLAGLIPAGFNSHHHRYQIPYVPLATLLVLAGWRSLVPARAPRPARAAAPLLIAVLLLPGLGRYQHQLAANAGNIHDQQVAMGRWIDAHLPPDAVVGLNDAGAIAYYGRRRVVDLVGLVSNGSALPDRAGPGSLFEWLEDLPPDRRPTHFAIFPAWFPYLRHTSLIGEKLAQFTLGVNTISGSDVKSLYRADWSRVDGSDALSQRAELVTLWGFSVVDALDVADLPSQRAHGYAAFDTWRDTLREFPVSDRPELRIIDGGRQPASGERFRLACRPGKPAVLVLRTEAYLGFALEVTVNGEDLGRWEIPRAPLAWTEAMFQVPDRVLTGRTARVELRRAAPAEGDFPYSTYHYWLLQ